MVERVKERVLKAILEMCDLIIAAARAFNAPRLCESLPVRRVEKRSVYAAEPIDDHYELRDECSGSLHRA